jgi:hypothetical protein
MEMLIFTGGAHTGTLSSIGFAKAYALEYPFVYRNLSPAFRKLSLKIPPLFFLPHFLS